MNKEEILKRILQAEAITRNSFPTERLEELSRDAELSKDVLEKQGPDALKDALREMFSFAKEDGKINEKNSPTYAFSKRLAGSLGWSDEFERDGGEGRFL